MDDEPCAHCREKIGFDASADGFYYCRLCYIRVEGVVQSCWEDSDMPRLHGRVQHHSKHRLRAPPLPSDGPRDFGTASPHSQPSLAVALPSELRLRYTLGIQIMIQSQCEALVQTFCVSPLICGLAGVIWMRFLVSTGVFDDAWADQTFNQSEVNNKGEKEIKDRYKNNKGNATNMYGQTATMIWFRAMKRKIPLSSCLSVCYLACHVAREPILPTDIYKWALEGKLPYLTAFLDIEKQLGKPPAWFPLSSSAMFKPLRVVDSRALEFGSASVAKDIGLDDPPVNFYALARRYLDQLPFPLEKVLPQAARVREWSMPSNLWLSVTPNRLPTRTCVMAILIFTVRVLYNINGFGIWEKSLDSRFGAPKRRKRRNVSDEKKSDPTKGLLGNQDSHTETAQVLTNLEAMYEHTGDAYEYEKDLPTYLKYCKDVLFEGLNPLLDGNQEERIIEDLWRFYEDEKHMSNNCNNSANNEDNIASASASGSSPKLEFHRALNALKLNMEENGFCYIPPRARAKRFDYLHYVRKNDGGARTFVAHADYYILLRACAQVAQVSVQDMHTAALDLEKKIADIEDRIDQSLHFTVNNPSSQSDDADLD